MKDKLDTVSACLGIVLLVSVLVNHGVWVLWVISLTLVVSPFCQEALLKSNEVFETFKQEIEKVRTDSNSSYVLK